MGLNPWDRQSIYDFNYFCCPECVFRSKDEISFQAHALKNHELSKTFFNSAFDEQMPEEPVIDIKQENEFDENQDDIPNDNQYDYMQYEIEPDPQLLEEDVKISPEELEKMIKENQDKEYKDDVENQVEEENYACSKCDESYRKILNLTKHYNKKHRDEDDTQYYCPLCPKQQYKELNNVIKHVRKVHVKSKMDADYQRNIKWIYCTYCPKYFHQQRSLETHIAKYHQVKNETGENEDGVKTEDAPIEKVKKPRKRKELKPEPGGEVLTCSECDFVSLRNRELIKHKRRMHPTLFKKGDKIFACDKCEKKFDFAHKLKNHIELTHEAPTFCLKCNTKFINPSDYIKHYQDAHGAMPPEYLHKETYVCDQCPRVFITKNHLREHIKRVHSKEYNSMGRDYVDSIKCSSCDVAFSSGNIYIQHYQAKHGDFPPEYIDREKFICDQCPKVFLEKHRMISHKRTVHSNKEKPPSRRNGFQCKFCDKKYTGRCNLKEHVMKDHEKRTPFHCEHCTRSFGTSTYLKSHIRQVHKRLKCEECGQEMCNTFILKRHKAKVHGLKDANEHQCKHCHLCFKLKAALTKHMMKIHPEVKFHEEV